MNEVVEYVSDNWGSFVSLASLIISVIMIGFAIRRAGQARDSATAARDAIVRVLTVTDLQRAIALIERLKGLHRENKWDASIGHYSDLRHMLADIDAAHPEPTAEMHLVLQEAIPQITVIEDNVDRGLREDNPLVGAGNFNERLNTIQVHLQKIASSTHFSGREAG